MPEAVKVWTVHLRPGLSRETKGTLAIESNALVFTADDGFSHQQIPLSDVRKARRVLGSPVLIVQYVTDGKLLKTAFYFSQPPLIEATGPISRRKARRANLQYLGMSNQAMKDLVRQWERAVQEAARAARG